MSSAETRCYKKHVLFALLQEVCCMHACISYLKSLKTLILMVKFYRNAIFHLCVSQKMLSNLSCVI